MNRTAIPWMTNVDCCGHRVNFDQELEKYGMGVLPDEYEEALEKFFRTKDKKKMLEMALKADRVPVWCKNCGMVEIVSVDSGKCVGNCFSRRSSMNRQVIASELLRIAKLLVSFWDLKIVPPSAGDIDKAKKVVLEGLKKEGMKGEKLEFQRFMVYQEHKECSGEDCKRNSNKHLCVFAFSDKDGKFGVGVAGGRLGDNNQPKLYQNWGVVGNGAAGEKEAKKLVDAYIKKKTTQADAYKEVKASVKKAEKEDKKVVKAQYFIFFPSRMETSELFKSDPKSSAADDWDYCLVEYDDHSQDVYSAKSSSGWKILERGKNPLGLKFEKEGSLDYSGERAKFKSLAK
jgi:hypothetical protein